MSSTDIVMAIVIAITVPASIFFLRSGGSKYDVEPQAIDEGESKKSEEEV